MNRKVNSRKGNNIMQDLVTATKPSVVSRVRDAAGSKYAAAGAAATIAGLALVPNASAADLTTTSSAPTDMVDAAKGGIVSVANDGKTIILFAAAGGLVLIGLSVLWVRVKKGIKGLASS